MAPARSPPRLGPIAFAAAHGVRHLSDLRTAHRVFRSGRSVQDLTAAVRHLLRHNGNLPTSSVRLALRACVRHAAAPDTTTTTLHNTNDRIVQLAEDVFVRSQVATSPTLSVWQALLRVYIATGYYDRAVHTLHDLHRTHSQVDLTTATELVRAACAQRRHEVLPDVIREIQRALEGQVRSGYLAKWSVTALGAYVGGQHLATFLRWYQPDLFDPLLLSLGFLYFSAVRVILYSSVVRDRLRTQEEDGLHRAFEANIPALFATKPYVLRLAHWLFPRGEGHLVVPQLYRAALAETTDSGHIDQLPELLRKLATLNVKLTRGEVEHVLLRTGAVATSAQLNAVLEAIRDAPLDQEHDVTVWDRVFTVLARGGRSALMPPLRAWLAACDIDVTVAQVQGLMRHYRRLGLDGTTAAETLWGAVRDDPALATPETLADYLTLRVTAGDLAGTQKLAFAHLEQFRTAARDQVYVTVILAHWKTLRAPGMTSTAQTATYASVQGWFTDALRLCSDDVWVQCALRAMMADLCNAIRDHAAALSVFKQFASTLTKLTRPPAMPAALAVRLELEVSSSASVDPGATILSADLRQYSVQRHPLALLFGAAVEAMDHLHAAPHALLPLFQQYQTLVQPRGSPKSRGPQNSDQADTPTDHLQTMVDHCLLRSMVAAIRRSSARDNVSLGDQPARWSAHLANRLTMQRHRDLLHDLRR
ncbi:hypothetical protein IWQ60_009360 [Tieghemiomyces parasiticus]|uniref:Uncharacterized protein n=1 Tax=Tieghemiomyces parasiticus TaxID=78921 RepID=A0A9W8DQ90_9FUNG|nr:hypothetical protein IWQ60_009360 [Tieghemiomyces parasiticus]